MTVRTAKRRHRFQPGSAMVAEAIPFPFIEPDDLVVSLLSAIGRVRLVRDIDYAVTGDGPSQAGLIRPLRVFADGLIIEVRRVTVIVQDTQIRPLQPFPAVSAERTLDRSVMSIQEAADDLADVDARALLADPGEVLAPMGALVRYVGKAIGLDAGKRPVPIEIGDANDPGLRSDLADANGGALIGFDGRDLKTKLRETASVADGRFGGAVGDGVTQSLPAFNAAAASLVDGGALDVPAGQYLVGETIIGPSRGVVHAYDLPIVGNASIVPNPLLQGAAPDGWTLAGFAPASPGATHVAGSAGKLLRSVTVSGYTNYLIFVRLKTTAPGTIGLYLADEPLFASDPVAMPVGDSITHQFSYFSFGTTGSIDIELRTDATWAGTVERFDIVRVAREAPFSFHAIPADQRSWKNPMGLKFGRFLAGVIVIGDRQTGANLGYDASWSIAIGARSQASNTGGEECTSIGSFTLQYNRAKHNSAGGYSALKYNLTGENNAAWGYKALLRNTAGSRNTGVGDFSGYYGSYGSQNVSVGYQAHYYADTGNLNTAIGVQAGLTNGSGSQNVYVGGLAGSLGDQTKTYPYNQTTSVGAETKVYGDRGVAVGFKAQCATDPNAGGAALNLPALAIGAFSFAGNECVAVGSDASTGVSMRSTVVGDKTSATGDNALAGGYKATAGERSVAIGGQAKVPHTNSAGLGYGVESTADNQLTLGNTGMTQFRAPTATITTISDRRDKTAIETIDPAFAVEVIKLLTPVRWQWAMRGEYPRAGGDTGFIAQDFDEVQQLVAAPWLGLVDTSDPDRFEATPGKLIPILVAAFQGALERAAASDARAADLQDQVTDLAQRMDLIEASA